MTKPNLFIVGAPKCGTTFLYHYLKKHSDIYFPEFKEPHFFGSDLVKNNKFRDASYRDIDRSNHCCASAERFAEKRTDVQLYR